MFDLTWLSKEEEFDLGGINMDKSKRFQEEPGKRLISPIEEREEEIKLINFSQLLK